MPKVYNHYHHDAPKEAVYIGRKSPYGNPFMIQIHGDRNKVCDMYEVIVEAVPAWKDKIKKELKGKDLLCFCKPKRCHGDYLLRIANEEDDDE